MPKGLKCFLPLLRMCHDSVEQYLQKRLFLMVCALSAPYNGRWSRGAGAVNGPAFSGICRHDNIYDEIGSPPQSPVPADRRFVTVASLFVYFSTDNTCGCSIICTNTLYILSVYDLFANDSKARHVKCELGCCTCRLPRWRIRLSSSLV